MSSQTRRGVAFQKFAKKKAAKTVKSLAKRITKISRDYKPELKHIGFSTTFNAALDETVLASYVGQMFPTLDRGDSAQQRQGNKIKLKSMSFNAMLRNVDPGTQNLPGQIRVMLILDKRANGEFLDPDKVNTPSVIPDVGANFDPWNMRNEEYRNRFKILHDKVYNIGGRSTPANDNNKFTTIQIKKKIKFGKDGYIVIYDNENSAGTYDAINQGTIWMIFRQNGGQTLGAAVSMMSRLYYTDV